MASRWLWTALLIAAFGVRGYAEDDKKFEPRRFVRKQSRVYVVIKPGLHLDRAPNKARARARYWLVRAENPVEAGVIPDKEWRQMTSRRGAPILKGDKVLAKGKLSHLPKSVRILDSSVGFVALDHEPRPGDETSVTIVQLGTKSRSYELSDLVADEVIQSIPYEGWGRDWLLGVAVDEVDGVLYIALRSEPLRMVSIAMDMGTAALVGPDDLAALAGKGFVEALPLVFQVANAQDVEQVRPSAAACLADTKQDVRVRLHAARFLRDEPARKLVTDLLGDPGADPTFRRDRFLAFLAAPATLGKGATPILNHWLRVVPLDATFILMGLRERDARSRACLQAMLDTATPLTAAEDLLRYAKQAKIRVEKLLPFLQSENILARAAAYEIAEKDPKRHAGTVLRVLADEPPARVDAVRFFTRHYHPGAFDRLRSIRGAHQVEYQMIQAAKKFQFDRMK